MFDDMTQNSTPAYHDVDKVCMMIGKRAGNLFLTRQLWCSGALLVVLNQALQGDLTDELAIRLTSGLGDGMGGSGCLCGALNAGALALGLFLGTGRLSPGGDRQVLKAIQELHSRFKNVFGSTCCRILMKNTITGSESHNDDCARRTSKTAELTAALIFSRRPQLIQQINWNYLNQKDGIIGARIKIVASRLKKQP